MDYNTHMEYDPLENLTNTRVDKSWSEPGNRVRLRDEIELNPYFVTWLKENEIDRRTLATVRSKDNSIGVTFGEAKKEPTRVWFDHTDRFEPA